MDERLAAVADLAGDGLVGESETIRRVAALVQRLLAIDITIVSEITADDRYLFRAIETAVELPIEEGAHIPYTWSLCSRIHAGEAGAATADTRENTGLSRNWARLKDGLGVDWDILAFMTTDVPLPDGGRFGTLCVHHTSTREWTTDERAVLVLLARLIGDEVARARADRRRAELVDELAHELRAPLQVIDGYAEAMLDGVVPRDDEHVVLVRSEAGRSLRMLDDLSLLVRLEVDDVTEPADDVDLGALLAATRDRLGPLAEAAGITLRVDGDAAAVARVPRHRLEQVLTNLARNALRAVGDGPGEIVLWCGDGGGETVLVGVDDDGAGIPLAEVERVFERFYRGTAARDAGPGSGLGLTIARRIVEGAGGSIAAERRDPRGTRFLVRLPSGGR